MRIKKVMVKVIIKYLTSLFSFNEKIYHTAKANIQNLKKKITFFKEIIKSLENSEVNKSIIKNIRKNFEKIFK